MLILTVTTIQTVHPVFPEEAITIYYVPDWFESGERYYVGTPDCRYSPYHEEDYYTENRHSGYGGLMSCSIFSLIQRYSYSLLHLP